MRENPHLTVPLVTLGAPPASARAVAVLVHGRDQDDSLMRDVARRLDLPDVAYVLPVAAGRTWYAGRYFDPVASLQPDLDHARAAIQRAISSVGVADDRLVLGGFSQGACRIADHIARAGPRPYAGAVILTGSLIGAPDERAVGALVPGLPMAFACGRADAWIPLEDARDTEARFRRAGAASRFTELEDREHRVGDQALAVLRSLLCG